MALMPGIFQTLMFSQPSGVARKYLHFASTALDARRPN